MHGHSDIKFAINYFRNRYFF